jgi:hypothetical protein
MELENNSAMRNSYVLNSGYTKPEIHAKVWKIRSKSVV